MRSGGIRPAGELPAGERRYLRFTLRKLFVVLTVITILLAGLRWCLSRIERNRSERMAAVQIWQMGGMTLKEWDDRYFSPTPNSSSPFSAIRWVDDLIGRQPIVSIYLDATDLTLERHRLTDKDVQHLAHTLHALPSLKTANLVDLELTDRQLGTIKQAVPDSYVFVWNR